MDGYDEYQRSLRYKNGYYAFGFVLIASLINAWINKPWGETQEVEYLTILTIALVLYIIRNTYQGAGLVVGANPKLVFTLSATYGLVRLYSLAIVSPNIFENLMINGRLSFKGVQLLVIFIFFAQPITYGITRIIEKRKDNRRDEDARI